MKGMFWIKSVFIGIVSLIALILASIPVGVAFWIWQWVNPETEAGRIVLSVVMMLIGGGFTIGLWVLIFMAWSVLVAGALSEG